MDLPPVWAEFTIAVTDITNNKAPGLNNAPPNAFMAMTPENLLHLFGFIIEFWGDRLDFIEWHEGQVFRCPKVDTFPTQAKGEG